MDGLTEAAKVHSSWALGNARIAEIFPGILLHRFCRYLLLQLVDEDAMSQVSAHGCLESTGQKTRLGAYTEKPFVHAYIFIHEP